MPIPTDLPIDATSSSTPAQGEAPLVLDWEHELDAAIADMEAGGFIEISPEDLDLWTETSLPPEAPGSPD